MEDHDHILARYKRIHPVSRGMSNALVELGMPSVERAAKALGVWVDGTIVMDDIDQSCVLMDYAIYDCPQDGDNAVERYAAGHRPAPGSEEAAVLAAMKVAFFSLFQVREVVRGVGVRVLDILRDREHFLADVAFSETAVEGIVLASRVLPFEGFITTTGAALPAGADVLQKVADCLDRGRLTHEDLRKLPREAWSKFTAMVIRACLRSDEGPRVRYEHAPLGRSRATVAKDAARPGRNAPCPCGSGRKYKKCCGR